MRRSQRATTTVIRPRFVEPEWTTLTVPQIVSQFYTAASDHHTLCYGASQELSRPERIESSDFFLAMPHMHNMWKGSYNYDEYDQSAGTPSGESVRQNLKRAMCKAAAFHAASGKVDIETICSVVKSLASQIDLDELLKGGIENEYRDARSDQSTTISSVLESLVRGLPEGALLSIEKVALELEPAPKWVLLSIIGKATPLVEEELKRDIELSRSTKTVAALCSAVCLIDALQNEVGRSAILLGLDSGDLNTIKLACETIRKIASKPERKSDLEFFQPVSDRLLRLTERYLRDDLNFWEGIPLADTLSEIPNRFTSSDISKFGELCVAAHRAHPDTCWNTFVMNALERWSQFTQDAWQLAELACLCAPCDSHEGISLSADPSDDHSGSDLPQTLQLPFDEREKLLLLLNRLATDPHLPDAQRWASLCFCSDLLIHMPNSN